MEKNKAYVGVIIPAAGSGARMGGVYKPLEKLCGRQMLLYSLDTFEKCDEVAFVVVAAREDKIEEIQRLCKENGYTKPIEVTQGGSDRQSSVENAFGCQLFNDSTVTHVAVHDAARPLLTQQMAKNVFAQAQLKSNAVCACRVRDTVKRTDETAAVTDSIDRDGLWLIQTPQVFEKDMYRRALNKAKNDGFVATDDSSLVSACGVQVNLCETPSYNIKITYCEDVFLAESILKERRQEMRIGHGYDVHRLVSDRRLVLGGVEIEHETGLLGHSDADVLTHALMDAMLGAAGLCDIGYHFPDTDSEYKDADSLVLLSRVKQLVENKGYVLSNADITVVAQAPKLRAYIEKMTENIAKTLCCDKDDVNIKATTEEKLGFTGRKEGISCHAVVALRRL